MCDMSLLDKYRIARVDVTLVRSGNSTKGLGPRHCFQEINLLDPGNIQCNLLMIQP